MPSNSGRCMVNLVFPASDIVVLVTISSKSNTLHGEERTVFENAADMVLYHTWFVNRIVKPAENDAVLKSYWVKAATKLDWTDVEMGKSVMTFLKSIQSSARSHLVSESKKAVEDLYHFAHKPPNEIKYTGSRMRGRTDNMFLKWRNDVLICLTTACMYHALKAWSSGSLVQSPDFSALTAQNIYLRQRATWQGLPPEVRQKLVDDTKKRIKKMLWQGLFIHDQESGAPLEVKDAVAYMELEISGDEKSEVEDDNSDPEGRDDVEALEEGWDEDE
ncbi:hypothetical protein HOY82DRAFT_618026 [Tuber indicum]|nr:hypothetical protein HOY82DRAFT_618026 [Tuber indicum]